VALSWISEGLVLSLLVQAEAEAEAGVGVGMEVERDLQPFSLELVIERRCVEG
jgi:hypothetical protein